MPEKKSYTSPAPAWRRDEDTRVRKTERDARETRGKGKEASKGGDHFYCSETKTPARPIPEPTHIDVTKSF